jgi:hypothetical protein
MTAMGAKADATGFGRKQTVCFPALELKYRHSASDHHATAPRPSGIGE